MFLSESCRGKAVLHYFNFCIIEQFWNIILHEKTHEIAGKLIASLTRLYEANIRDEGKTVHVVFKNLGVGTGGVTPPPHTTILLIRLFLI
jgi:hypothetical protein